MLESCVVKGAELPDGHREKTYKGRAVLGGSLLKHENDDVAPFHNIGAAPASMKAGKAVDAFGLQTGYDIEYADATAAYTQCVLSGTPTWVRLPEDRLPN